MSDMDEIVRPAVVLRGHLHAVDQAVTMTNLTYKEQIAVCALATALAFRRFLAAAAERGQPYNRAQRHQLIKSAVKDFEDKVKQYGAGDQD